ncbi:MAG TPA: hypothetical protein VJG30_00640 [Candidatus Nanoarchaeia archaeon]|nr:hypothetical protein [Candidatus Nanoarchaeia archaeon]
MLEVITGLVTNAVSLPVNAGWVIFAILVLLLLLYTFRNMLDTFLDLWKIPITIVLDAVDVLAYNNPYLDIAACLGNLFVFWVLTRKRHHHHLAKIFGVIVATEALIGIWILPQYAFITNLLPLSTIMMFILIRKH